MRYFLITVFVVCFWMQKNFADDGKVAGKKTVCLNMIVKNEKDVICRCLETVKPLIDYWVIVDTGSTDGTQKIIKDFMKGIPGELHERPWVDFAHNRNQALDFAKNKADYVLVIDADETFKLEQDFRLPNLDKDFYYIMTSFGGMKYARVQLVNNHLNWKWIGVLHEALDCPQAKNAATLQGITNVVFTDGARSKDPKKYYKDAKVLETALKKEPTNKRYQFYLAQSYKDAGELELAIKHYEKRVEMGGWDQEIYWSLFQVALLKERLEKPNAEVIESYKKAHNYRKTRIEPLYHLANLYRRIGNYQEGYKVAHQALSMPMTQDNLFVAQWMYDYGAALEFSICAYWLEKYTEAELSSYLLLAKPDLPANVRECVQNNLKWAHAKLQEAKEKEEKLALKN